MCSQNLCASVAHIQMQIWSTENYLHFSSVLILQSVHVLIYPTMNNRHGQQPGWARLVEDNTAGSVLIARFFGQFGWVGDFALSTEKSVLQTEYETTGQPQVPPPPTHICSLHSSAAANMTKTITPSQSLTLPYQIPKPCSFPGHKNTAAASSVDQLNMLICQQQM